MFRYLQRQLQKDLAQDYGGKPPIQVLYGARRTGKSTLLKNTFPEATYIDVEKGEYIPLLNSRDTDKIQGILSTRSRILILDEFQRLTDPGLIAKVIFDHMPNVALILSGSSAIEISNKATESMAGRALFHRLYPLSYFEKMAQDGLLSDPYHLSESDHTLTVHLPEILRYGLYPLPSTMIDKAQYLEGLIESSLTKDIFYLDTIRNTKVIKDLLILLAYQIGQVVNYTDIAQRLGITRVTVKKYVDLLEKLFIIFTIRPFRSKRRDEIGLAEKVYFYDVGVRNALIGQFEPPNIRADLGHLFENYVIAECVKLNDYFHRKYELRYWRTKGGSKIDLVLVRGLEPVAAFEIKYSNGAVSSAFKDTYSLTPQLITSTNFVSILSQTFIQQR